MHEIKLNPAVVERVMRRRGRLAMFETIDPRRTALLAIDMQNWMIDRKQPTSVRYGHETIRPINLVADTLRDRGGTVVWIRMVSTPEAVTGWRVFYDGAIANQRDMFVEALGPDSEGGKLHPELHVRPEDIISDKTRYSCMLTESSDLHAQLAARDVDTVIVSGVVTNVCCESSARDAMMMNYKTIVLSDGCAAHTDEEHNASLSNLLNMFADIRTGEDVAAMLRAPSAKAS